jgi:hypothetical protein
LVWFNQLKATDVEPEEKEEGNDSEEDSDSDRSDVSVD